MKDHFNFHLSVSTSSTYSSLGFAATFRLLVKVSQNGFLYALPRQQTSHIIAICGGREVLWIAFTCTINKLFPYSHQQTLHNVLSY